MVTRARFLLRRQPVSLLSPSQVRSLSTVLRPPAAVAGSATRNADAVVASLSSAGELRKQDAHAGDEDELPRRRCGGFSDGGRRIQRTDSGRRTNLVMARWSRSCGKAWYCACTAMGRTAPHEARGRMAFGSVVVVRMHSRNHGAADGMGSITRSEAWAVGVGRQAGLRAMEFSGQQMRRHVGGGTMNTPTLRRMMGRSHGQRDAPLSLMAADALFLFPFYVRAA